MDLIDIFREFHPNSEEYTFISAHGTFFRVDHILGHKSNLRKFKKIETASSISSHNAITLDITGVGCHFLLQCMKVKSESEVGQSCPTLPTPWTAAYQAPLSMGFFRQEYWSGVSLPSPLVVCRILKM